MSLRYLSIALVFCGIPFFPMAQADASGTPSAAGGLPPDECALTLGYPFACPRPLLDLNLVGPSHAYDAAASDPGLAGGPIDVWGYCRYVDNITAGSASPQSAFVPFRSSLEWLSFINNAPTNVFALSHCARPTIIRVPPDTTPADSYYDPVQGDPNTCISPSPPTQPLMLPYGRQNQILSMTTSFVCTVQGSAGQTWTKTATVKFYGLDSDNLANIPSWRMIDIIYGGTPPGRNPMPP